jgi:iron(III) transport system substrate-binding protein
MSIANAWKGVLPVAILAAANAVAPTVDAASLSKAEIAVYSGADRQKVLEEGAKKEGEVMWYTSLIVDQASKPIMDAFSKKYPFLKPNFIRMDSTDILQRILAEGRARSVRSDVVTSDIADGLKQTNLVQGFKSPLTSEYPESYVDKEGLWVQTRTSWQGIAWNTNLVKEAEAPQTWEALLEPKWKGKLAWASSANTGAPRLITYLRLVLGEDKALDYLKKLKDQDIRTLPGSVRSVLDQVIAGEKAIGVSMSMHHIAISKSVGAPVHGAEPDPVLARREAVALMKDAPHPYAAMLLIDFQLSRDGGQQVFRAAQYNPAHPAVEPLPEMKWI